MPFFIGVCETPKFEESKNELIEDYFGMHQILTDLNMVHSVDLNK